MFGYVYIAIDEEYKVKADDSQIYIFDETLNKEIRGNINFMFARKFILIGCVFAVIFGIIIQFIIAIKKDIKKEVKKDMDIKNISNDNLVDSKQN